MVLPEPLGPKFVGDNLPAALNEERDAINLLDGAVEDRIPFPPGAQTGDTMWFDGVEWLTTETRFFEGTGRPDGKVAAPIGSRYIDKDGDQGAVLWVKRADADLNTGWICLAGDTGDRNVSAEVLKRTGTVVNSAHLQRSGQIVHFYLDITMPNSAASPYKVFALPAGFRPVHSIYGGLTDNKEGADTGGTLVDSDGTINIYNPVPGKRDRYHGIWPTQEAWPIALPGA
jgi:hypothetical protein